MPAPRASGKQLGIERFCYARPLFAYALCRSRCHGVCSKPRGNRHWRGAPAAGATLRLATVAPPFPPLWRLRGEARTARRWCSSPPNRARGQGAVVRRGGDGGRNSLVTSASSAQSVPLGRGVTCAEWHFSDMPTSKPLTRNVRREQPAWSEPDLKTCYFKAANSCVLGDLEITEVGFARRGFVRPKHQHRAPILGGVRTMLLAGLDVN